MQESRMVAWIDPNRWYRATFFAGMGLLGLGSLLGVAHALREGYRLPPLAVYSVGGGSAEDLIDQADYEGAVRQLRLMLRLVPAGAETTHNLLGRALEAQGQYEEAAQHFREAIAIQPTFAEAHNNLGVALARQGQLEAAVVEVREALRLNPQLAEAQQNLPRMEAKLRQATGATSMEGSAAQAAAAAPPEIERGRAYVRQFYRGELEALYAKFDPTFAAKMTLAAFTDVRKQAGIQLGPEVSVVEERLGAAGETTLYVRKARFERAAGEVEVVIQLGADGSVMGFLLRPVATN